MRAMRTPPTRSIGLARGRHRVVGATVVLAIALAAPSCGDDDSDVPASPTTPTTPDSTSPAELPDFVITDVTVQPGGPMVPPGEVTITANVRNVGDAGYSNAIVVQAPGNHTGVLAAGLPAGASGPARITFPVVSPNATYRLTLVVDPDDVTAESNEANNESGELVIVTTP